MENEKYRIKVEAVTPVSVGGGDGASWKRGVDYLYKDGKVYHLDLERVRTIGRVDPGTLAELLIRGDERGLMERIGSRLPQVADCVMDCPLTMPFDIKTFIREGLSGRAYIPGSTLKGAIRSVLFTEWGKREVRNAENAREMEDAVFGMMSDGSDFMRFVQVGDIPFDHTGLVNTKIFNLHKDDGEWRGGWKHKREETTDSFLQTGFNTLYECLMPRSVGYGTIVMHKKAFELYGSKQPLYKEKSKLFDESEGYNTFENLCDIINSHTFDYLKKEEAFFLKYKHADNSEDIKNGIRRLQEIANQCIEKADSCLLKMAAGSGFHSITGDWRYDDYDDTGFDGPKKKLKSRKIAAYGDPMRFNLMGFVKLTLER